MNKYEEAFNVIETILHLMCGEEREDGYRPSHDEMVNSMEDLKELVDKSTPSKIKHDRYYDEIEDNWMDEYYCPCCNEAVNHKDNYCSNCGQALDWRVEND